MYGALIAKAIIVLVVFPVVFHVVFTVVTALVNYILSSGPAIAESWSTILGKGVVGAALLIAVASSVSVCRRLWPTTIVKAK
jgi:succinate dehydrogenase/fumarate reductase cytochrome b subunit